MRIACLHTAQVHVATFTDFFDDKAPDAQVIHVVRDDLLALAQVGGIAMVEEPFMNAVAALDEADAILCTCSTLGPLVDQLGNPKVVRIDRPVMNVATGVGPKPLLALCLESTRAASLDLLMQAGANLTPTVHLCDGAWAFFEAGDMAGFADAIASSIRTVADGHDCVVLGQASMRVAEPALRDLGIPVLSSPALAVDHTIGVALS
ncbi:aspartate/glutamate racemase family protein [Loktanella sp. F6476L]|uniref:aspartate/glutamate racemase family protein n=1 Tax=Loktanella sp. F6476L TaxID=2926405 RepID=UPI001FF16B02|nr:aspartate/glutamate racemase family protein [Loktanella sp. F6476L]MCK0121248.1 aspartate/glutamate racemase family protein [Loktanella sp. F6476L]